MSPRIGTWSESRLRVHYCETDAMGIAHHAEYLAWYEVARTDWIRGDEGSPQRSYRALEQAGFFLPVVEMSSAHLAPARYDDEIVARARLAEASRVVLAFDYEIVRAGDGTLLARGRTVHAVVGRDGRPRRLPQETLAWLVGDGPAAPP